MIIKLMHIRKCSVVEVEIVGVLFVIEVNAIKVCVSGGGLFSVTIWDIS